MNLSDTPGVNNDELHLLAFYRMALKGALENSRQPEMLENEALTPFQKGFAHGFDIGIRTAQSLVEKNHTSLIGEWVMSKSKNINEGKNND